VLCGVFFCAAGPRPHTHTPKPPIPNPQSPTNKIFLYIKNQRVKKLNKIKISLNIKYFLNKYIQMKRK